MVYSPELMASRPFSRVGILAICSFPCSGMEHMSCGCRVFGSCVFLCAAVTFVLFS